MVSLKKKDQTKLVFMSFSTKLVFMYVFTKRVHSGCALLYKEV